MISKNQSTPTCHICGSQNSKVLPNKVIRGGDSNQKIIICTNCSAVYIWPRWSNDRYGEFYKKQYRDLVGIAADSGTIHRKFMHNTLRGDGVAEFVSPFLKSPTANIIDLGAGEGGILNAFKQREYTNLSALEPNIAESEYLRAQVTENVTLGLLQDSSLPQANFDLALIVASIDHFQTPMDQLRQVRNILKKGGLLYVDGYDIFRASEVGFEQFKADHCYYYNAPLMLAMLSACGFSPVRFLYDNLASVDVGNQKYVRRLSGCCFRILARKDGEECNIGTALNSYANNREYEILKYIDHTSGIRRLLTKVLTKYLYA